MVEATNPSGPIWDVATAKGIVAVSGPKPGVCEVMAYRAPVARTFKGVLSDARRKAPSFKSTLIEPGYDPIVYRLEHGAPPRSVALELRGAEPGAPRRMFRFSMLTARITYAPDARPD